MFFVEFSDDFQSIALQCSPFFRCSWCSMIFNGPNCQSYHFINYISIVVQTHILAELWYLMNIIHTWINPYIIYISEWDIPGSIPYISTSDIYLYRLSNPYRISCSSRVLPRKDWFVRRRRCRQDRASVASVTPATCGRKFSPAKGQAGAMKSPQRTTFTLWLFNIAMENHNF